MRSRSQVVENKPEETKPASPIAGFMSHSRFEKHPRLAEGFERIIEKTFKVDVEAEYERLNEVLVIDPMLLGERGEVTVHLNRAERNFRDAHNLWVIAKQESKRWEVQNELVIGGMREAATAELNEAKKEFKAETKSAGKQITEKDVDHRAAVLFPDEWRHAKERETSVKLMVERFENLVDAWRSRCQSLRSILDSRRGG